MKIFWYQAGVVLVVILSSIPLFAQTLESTASLPNSPGLAPGSGALVQSTSPVAGTSVISGVVQDPDGDPVNAASITLAASGDSLQMKEDTGSDGHFTFKNLPAGRYHLIVSAPGLTAYTSEVIILAAGQTLTEPPIQLQITSNQSVNVVATSAQIAKAQIHEEEQQRVLGVFPNFYTTFIWNAQPMTTPLKFKLALRSLIDPVQFLSVAATAGLELKANTYSGYGTGIQAYGKLYGTAFADSVDSRMLGGAILPSLFHQDPRYFYQGSGSIGSRTRHAIASAFLTRGDKSGRNQLNYSHLLGTLAAAGISNAYRPDVNRGAGITFETFGITIAGTIGEDLFREFVLRDFTSSVPSYAHGKSAPSHQDKLPDSSPIDPNH